MHKFGTTQKKIMLVLLGSVALGVSNSPGQYFKTLRILKKDWKNIDQRNFNRSISTLAKEKLVKEKIFADGSFKLVLTREGKKQAKMLSLMGQSISFKKPKKWDKKWRIVLFDIPEKNRAFRDILRNHLRELKFLKLQHSVFISPHPFEKAILEVIELYSAQKYVRVITALKIDNEEKIKKHFSKFFNVST